MTKFVFSIDDAGSGGDDMIESFRRTSRHLESRGIRGTWFFVPYAGGQPVSDGWKRAALEMRDAGQDIQLHGRTHGDCYEFGPPNFPATRIVPDFITQFEARREELLQRYTVANLRGWMEQGLEVFERDLGIRPTAFRAPCGAVSKAMYEALAQLGIGVHSCMYISAVGYEHLPHLSSRLEQYWTDTIPHRPYRWYSGVIEAPILNEYTWRGASARSDDYLKLAREDIDRVVTESPVAIILMHTHGIADSYEHAFRLIDAVMEHVAANGYGEFSTVKELIESGEMAAAATVEGPDILEV
ncbi:MAG: DUF2334 domain-containing protein [Armatimonadetes bacterium]|nr:DUF2334 domain-containing protein [Armatimonadota bacterium]